MKPNELMAQAVAKWGVESQKKMAMEEMSELIVAMMHYDRGRVDKMAVVEEIVDVSLVLEQLLLIYAVDIKDFDLIVTQKLKRLEKLLSECNGATEKPEGSP